MIILMEKVFTTEEIHLLKLGHEFPEELRGLVRKELDAISDLSKHLLGNLTLNGHWKLIENHTNILWDNLFIKAIILYVHLDVFLQLIWNAISFRELK